MCYSGAADRTRTDTIFLSRDFKSRVSAYFTTAAYIGGNIQSIYLPPILYNPYLKYNLKIGHISSASHRTNQLHQLNTEQSERALFLVILVLRRHQIVPG